MKWQKWLEQWDMTSLKVKTPFLDMEWQPQDEDKSAAWELYVELLTRVTTQPLAINHGDEETALNSIYSIFPTTRDVMKRNGRHCVEFTKIAVLVLNQKIRPFTAKWHRMSSQGAFSDEEKCMEFRTELSQLQTVLKVYTQMLADMAGVEDLTELENET
nr:hypothetical protein [uncultured Desulfuromonas sp.]